MNIHNTATLKRRRPYGHEDFPSERVFHSMQAPTRSSSYGSPTTYGATGSYYNSPDSHQYILEQAASILSVTIQQLVQSVARPEQDHDESIVEQAARTLNVPVERLHELSRNHSQRYKRSRLHASPTTSLPPKFSHQGASVSPVAARRDEMEEEKFGPRHDALQSSLPCAGPDNHDPATGPEAGSFLNLGGARLANYFSGFSVCNPCPSFDSSDYASLDSASALANEYGAAGACHLSEAEPAPVAAALAQARPISSNYSIAAPTSAGSLGEPHLLDCDEPNLLGGYGVAPQYHPPLRPKQNTAAGLQQQQPATSREAMFYPDSMPRTTTTYSSPMPNDSCLVRVLPEVPPLVTDGFAAPSHLSSGITTSSPQSSNPTVMAAAAEVMPSYFAAPGLAEYGVADARCGNELWQARPPQDLDNMYPSHRAPPAKRGPFKDHAERQKTAYTRKIGSCIRCRMQRIRCHTDPDNNKGPCGTCSKVANANKIWRLPCLRLKISDVILSKPGQVKGFEWTRRWKDSVVTDDISNWASNDTKTIRVTEGFTGGFVELRVRQFVPQEGDLLERSWMVGNVKRSVRIPPFALVDMDQAKGQYDTYIKTGVYSCCTNLIDSRQELLRQTYGLALKMGMSDSLLDRKERQLLCWTLELWMSIRLTTTSFEIIGDETLGMTHDIMGETSPLRGKIPLPPVLGAQLDSILIHQIQARFRHDTLDLLQKMTQENKSKTWLTTYLATFMLLHNVALVIKHDASYARKHGMKTRFAREEKVKQYYMGAITLLAYFHYRGGSKIFASDFKDEDFRLHSGEEATQFMAFTRRHAKDRERQWQELVQSPDIEDEFYFIAQLYEQNWLPRSWPE